MPLDMLDDPGQEPDGKPVLDPRLARAARTEQITRFEFTSQWTAIDEDPCGGAEEWTLKAMVNLEDKISFRDPVKSGIDTRSKDLPFVTIARADGFMLRPYFMMALSGWDLMNVFDAPSSESMWLYETLYRNEDDDGLSDDALEIVGADIDGPGIVPDLHVHVRSIAFADGFASRRDLESILDHLVARFDSSGIANTVISLESDAIPGLALESAHDRIKTESIMEELGFRLLGDVFLHRSQLGSVEKARMKRLSRDVYANIRRKPL